MQVNKKNASVPAANIQYYDIKLQYTTNGTDWHDATKEHFPAGGITVTIPYSDLKSGLDKKLRLYGDPYVHKHDERSQNR